MNMIQVDFSLKTIQELVNRPGAKGLSVKVDVDSDGAFRCVSAGDENGRGVDFVHVVSPSDPVWVEKLGGEHLPPPTEAEWDEFLRSEELAERIRRK